jgi:adenosylcobinamide kinase/adenosylcobinamide-phosphate guanylyltransferase
MLNGGIMAVIFVIGGARSGKSTFAELKAKEYSEKVVYIATGVITDKAMADRVKRHRDQRPDTWHTLEMYRGFETLREKDEFMKSEVVLLDCITTMIGNFMVDSKLNFDTCSLEEVNELENKITQEVFSLIKVCRENDKKLIIVSNETGMGLVPPYFMGNYFRDMSGRVNNKIGAESDHMYFIFSGIPIKLKHKGEMVKWPQDF